MNTKSNKPSKHHYVPQFYLRRFANDVNAKKVPTLRNNGASVVIGQSAIKNIAYEDNLYAIDDKKINTCIEESINHEIESPITQSRTWQKIADGSPELLTVDDMPALYILARHFQARNIETLEFVVSEANSSQSPAFAPDYTPEEIEMHERIKNSPTKAKELFLFMSQNVEQFLVELSCSRVCILTSVLPLRTSTNPSIFLPIEHLTGLGIDFGQRNYWLPLTRTFGALVMLQHPMPGFSEPIHMPTELSRYMNRAYICQLLESKSLRYCIAHDEYIEDDLNWAHYFKSDSNNRKFLKKTTLATTY